MATFSALFHEHKTLHRQYLEIERTLADLECQMLEANSTRTRRDSKRPRTTKAEMAEVVRDTVKVLRDASEPLLRREVASRLGVSLWVAGYRLNKAIRMKFVEKVAPGRYRTTNVVPAF